VIPAPENSYLDGVSTPVAAGAFRGMKIRMDTRLRMPEIVIILAIIALVLLLLAK
jgi:hypothetical protein